ncbi:hypothetical protein NE865_14386 [Phthorimaea operculella]|nr:hypothetical protein NE865_14386 [Phthorimaea operculella]
MKQILFLVLSTVGVALALDLFDLKQGVRSKFGLGFGRGSNYYYDIPIYTSEAISQGWTKVARPEGPLPSLELYCPPEYSVCALFDDTGYIAGMQTAVQKDKFKNATLDWTIQGYKTWNVNGVEFWAIQEYFVNEEFLKKSPEERISSRDNSTTLQLDSMWVTIYNGELLEIPKDEKKVDPIWAKQTCFPGMGQHYYYDLEKDPSKDKCASDQILPWFIIYYQGELVATLWSTYGIYPVEDGERDWFERPSRTQIAFNFPDSPECHKVLTEHTVATHIWFIENPQDTVCVDLPITKIGKIIG